VKKYSQLIVNNGDACHYKIKVHEKKINDTVYRLFRSKMGDWSEHLKGTVAAKLKDNGNGVVLKLEGREINFDYCEVEEIALLLRTYRQHRNLNRSKLRFLKPVELMK
jgi:hypothetical protein